MTDHLAALEELADGRADFYPNPEQKDALRAAIALMRGQSWQPIESAPKDGRRVLAYAGSRPFIARHGRVTGWWDDNDLMRDPALWMDLPAPPQQEPAE